MITAPPGWKPRRLPDKYKKKPISSEEKAKQKAESEESYRYCRAIFEQVRPELIQEHYNWYITIDRNSGKYFIEKEYMAIFEKFRNHEITGKCVTFRLNETGGLRYDMIEGRFEEETNRLFFEISLVTADGEAFPIEALLDTGFTGWLAVKIQDLESLNWEIIDDKLSMRTAKAKGYLMFTLELCKLTVKNLLYLL